ncbi:MAG: class I SAM-dependent methyltransferase [Burkholderiaceae bacterium]|nr:class I SAM-dependent methyltransferase [Burkholderiaceae bacterium]
MGDSVGIGGVAYVPVLLVFRIDLKTADKPMKTLEIPLHYTHDFVGGLLPPRSRVLEVGCGGGELAARLQQDGHHVLAIDISEEAVEKARSLGVAAQLQDFVEFAPAESFDAILFTRSLHHIAPLERAAALAFELLKPEGTLVVEDFDYEAMDPPTVEWLYRLAEILGAAGLMRPFTEQKGQDRLEDWIEGHRHDPPLHTGRRMWSVLAERFPSLQRHTCCYLFRYFCQDLVENASRDEVASRIFDWEASLVERGQIRAIGLRLLARR